MKVKNLFQPASLLAVGVLALGIGHFWSLPAIVSGIGFGALGLSGAMTLFHKLK